MKKATLILSLFAILAISVPVFACGNDDASIIKASDVKTDDASFEGTLVCLGCDLKKIEGANSECKISGHTFAIKTADGSYISLMENKYSTDLLNVESNHNKAVKVQGVYFAKANMLDVKSFTIDGKENTWCGQCSKMDGCGVSSKKKM
ncbi:MAG: hypothetical protein ABIJ12_06495 [bacterium]